MSIQSNELQNLLGKQALSAFADDDKPGGDQIQSESLVSCNRSCLMIAQDEAKKTK